MKYWTLAALLYLPLFFIACRKPIFKEEEAKNNEINDPILRKLANCNKLVLCKVETDSKDGIFKIQPIRLVSDNTKDLEIILSIFKNKENSRGDYPGAGVKSEFLMYSSDAVFLLQVINYNNICVIEEVEVDNNEISINTNNFIPSNMRIVSSKKLVDFLHILQSE